MSYLQSSSKTSKKAIIPQLNKVQKVSNNKKLSKDNKDLFGSDANYNCWGFTAFSFKWLSELEWFEENEMEYCLANFTKKVKKPKIGDIVVMREDNVLLHTAILTGIRNKTVVHKPGYCRLEVNTIAAKKIYRDTDNITFRRAQKGKFDYDYFNDSEYSYDNFSSEDEEDY